MTADIRTVRPYRTRPHARTSFATTIPILSQRAHTNFVNANTTKLPAERALDSGYFIKSRVMVRLLTYIRIKVLLCNSQIIRAIWQNPIPKLRTSKSLVPQVSVAFQTVTQHVKDQKVLHE